ncbi:MAG: hypothetical protein AAF433_11490 [Bacteroidota bacterium]
MRLFLLFLAIWLLGFSSLSAQRITSFPVDEGTDIYLDALEDYLLASRNNRIEEAFELFNGLFLSGAFVEEQQLRIMKLTNMMLERRIPKSSGYVDYLGSLEQLKNLGDNPDELFDQYHGMLEQLLASSSFRSSQYDRVVSFARSFNDQRQLSADTRGTYWKVLGGRVSWGFDNSPWLKVDDLDRLVAISNADSMTIIETSIQVDILEREVSGRGGLANWLHMDLPEEVYAELNEYNFQTNRGIYTASSATMHYPEYFGEQPLHGTFSDKIQIGGVRASAEYPQFTSSDGYLEIRNVGEGINLRGNFEIRGSTVYAIGDEGRTAEVRLSIENEAGTEVLRGSAERFSIKQQERVVGNGVETTIYFGEDSLYHPSVTMKVDVEERLVQLVRTNSGADRNPFYHSLNRINIHADYLDIYLDQDSIVVGRPTVSFAEKGDVTFESEDFFSAGDYYRLQNIAEVNPLVLLLALRQQETGNDFISTERVAQRINPRFTTSNIQSLLFELAAGGFITYDVDNQRVRLKPKVEHYVRADRGDGDYDRVTFRSVTDSINASMNLRTGEITVGGVRPVEFNREKRLAILPLGDQITIFGDRDADFDGKIFAGMTVLEGKDLHFKYRPYQIVMDSIRYMDLFLPEQGSNPDDPNMLSIGSRIEHVTGILLLDAPNNKSGREDIDIFPSIQTDGSSFIYYDAADSTAAYNRDSFFFEMEPFTFQSLHDLREADLEFEGKLVSGGIFPDLEEKVTLQEDGSLGFLTSTEATGTEAYGGRGNYEGQIELNNNGLGGQGTLSYIGAEVESEDLRFELERTTASARQFNLEEETGERDLPQVRGQEVNIDWRPYVDSMLIRSVEETPFSLYQSGVHTFDGLLVLTPEGLKGTGILDWPAASLSSQAIDFAHYSAHADTANVRIQSLDADERLALKTSNVEATVDFENQRASFENNGDELVTILPYNQFQTSIKRFDWDMAGNRIEFESENGLEGRFTSIHPDQDSLTFLADEAIYDLNTSLLELSGVDSVRAADATIYLSDGELQVEPGGKVTELTDCQIIADTINRHHVINRATVNILGRRVYRASGFYEYNVGPHVQELELQEIVGQPIGRGAYSEKATSTRAEGEVGAADEFYIDNQTRFQGTINLDATNSNLFFDGIARIEADNLHRPQWFKVGCEGDKDDLTLEVDEPQGTDGYPLHTGFYLSKDRQLVYPSMIQTLDFRKDHPILPIGGVVRYDEDRDRFLFGDSSRVINNEPLGNIMIFDDQNATVSGEGSLGLGGRLTYVQATSFGRINMDVPPPPLSVEEEEEPGDLMEAEEEENNDIMILPDEEEEESEDLSLTIEEPLAPVYPTVSVEAMTGVNMMLPPKLFDIMTTDIKSASFATPALNLVSDPEFYRNAVLNMFPESREREEAMNGMALGVLDIPKKINAYSFLFSRLNFEWVEDYQSFVSTEDKTGLVSINGESINKMLEIHVEFKMPSAGDDRLYIYIKSPSDLWYYFGFRDGILNLASNNTAFMDELNEMKPRDMVIKMDDGGTFELLPVELSTASAFLRRMDSAFTAQ